MVYDLDSKVIIMLCNEYEGGRKKCEKYWDANIYMNRFKIIIQRMQDHYMYCIREIKLINLPNKEERIVYQVHFT